MASGEVLALKNGEPMTAGILKEDYTDRKSNRLAFPTNQSKSKHTGNLHTNYLAGLGFKAWSMLLTCSSNCNCNWGTCIAPPTRRPRAQHRVNPYPGAHRQNETEMFSDHDGTSLSIAAVSAPSVACSTLVVQQQNRLCRQFVDVSAARRGSQVQSHWGNQLICCLYDTDD